MLFVFIQNPYFLPLGLLGCNLRHIKSFISLFAQMIDGPMVKFTISRLHADPPQKPQSTEIQAKSSLLTFNLLLK